MEVIFLKLMVMAHPHLLNQRGSRIQEQVLRLFMNKERTMHGTVPAVYWKLPSIT